jgi:hypothetical protein
LLDSKQDAKRVNPGRSKPARIYRPLTAIQKRLGVRMAYIDIETRDVWIVPLLDHEEADGHI